MTFVAGARLGPYEILGPLGAGGMGEVYRARDERLAREVAIKVLPAGLAHDPERMRRFEREAKAVGSLNHPHILAVYDTGHHEGSPYVVSELLEGQTLRERLAGGALPPRKAIEIATQTARGLAAAHEKGIVHRDLKPENLFVTHDGHVKILDFGLAKLTLARSGDASHSPTLTQHTDPGVVLGTVGYMSPEQVRGAPVDHRSDVFSFGAILYEMLTGRRAFRRETSAETMAAILREDPPDLTATHRALPFALERIVAHCLEKNPQERFASARDLAFDLESVSDKSALSATQAFRGAASSSRRARRTATWLLAFVALAAVFWAGRRTSERSQPKYMQLSFGHGNVPAARFSPDGGSVLYSASWNGAPARVFSLRLDLQVEEPLGFEGSLVGVAAGELAFVRSDGTLVRTRLVGGGVREVAKGVALADLSRDGTRFAIVRRDGAKHVLEYPIGKVLHETLGAFAGIRISPDGARVAFIENPNATVVAGGWVGSVEASGVKRWNKDPLLVPSSLVWSPDGKDLWFTTNSRKDASIYAVSSSGRLREILRTGYDPRLHATFGDGRVLLSLGGFRREVAGLAPGESVERNLSLRGLSQSWDLTADGRHYLIGDEVGEGGFSAFLGDLRGGPLVRLGPGVPNAISPDGRFVLAWKNEEFGTGLVVLPTGAGEPRDVHRGTIRSYLDARYLPDGQRILLSASEEDRPRRLFVQELPDGLPKPVTPEGIFTEYAFTTPDGEWVPAGSDYTAAPYLLYPLAGGEPRPIRGLAMGDQPMRFSSDGRLFVRDDPQDGPRASIGLLDLVTGKKQPFKVLSPSDPAGVSSVGYAYLTPDGRAYVYDYNRRLSDLFLVEGLE